MTTLVRWSPFRELDLMERNMRRVLESAGFAPALIPAADVYETKDEFVLELEAPGFDQKELGIEVTDHTLTVKGERKVEETEEVQKDFRLHERLERVFERRFELPREADTAAMKATFKEGVLELHVPKAKEILPKKVPISKG